MAKRMSFFISIILTLACVACTSIATPAAYVYPTSTISQNTSTIDWSVANQYSGESKTVCGPVMDTNYATSSNGQPTFLNVGKKYPDPSIRV